MLYSLGALRIQSPSENGSMEPEYIAFRRWLYTPIILWRSVIGSIEIGIFRLRVVECPCTYSPYSCRNARLPQSRKWRMGPSKTSLLYTTAIFHFHEYGRRGMRVCFIFPKGSHCYTRKVGVPCLFQKKTSLFCLCGEWKIHSIGS